MSPEQREAIVQAARRAAAEAPPMTRALQARVASRFGLVLIEDADADAA